MNKWFTSFPSIYACFPMMPLPTSDTMFITSQLNMTALMARMCTIVFHFDLSCDIVCHTLEITSCVFSDFMCNINTNTLYPLLEALQQISFSKRKWDTNNFFLILLVHIYDVTETLLVGECLHITIVICTRLKFPAMWYVHWGDHFETDSTLLVKQHLIFNTQFWLYTL